MTSPSSETSSSSAFLKLPPEIRLKIYSHVFSSPEPIKIEPAHPTSQQQVFTYDTTDTDTNTNEEEQTWLIRPPTPSGLSSQLLRTCRQIHHESLPVLYPSNTFNCSARESVPLLQHNIGLANFSLIRHLVLDWEQLQDFAWSLAKREHQRATSGLEIIDLATWRARILGGSSLLWRDVKAYEHQLCQAALDICQKHAQLRVVLQTSFYRFKQRPPAETGLLPPGKPVMARTSHRIKWRFVTEKGARTDHYGYVVDLQSEVASLNIPSGNDGKPPQQQV